MQQTPPSASGRRILIVEDEFIISDTIADQLREQNYIVTGEAISYDEAVELYHKSPPDLALLDIRLSGPESGIDFAHFLRAQKEQIPFVYLTSQVDEQHLALARETFPAGYLSKPVQINSLLTTIDVALHNHQSQQQEETVAVKTGQATHILPLSAIRHLRADHVYVQVSLVDQKPLVLRRSLSDLVSEINHFSIVQTHRSHAVNLQHVTRYEHRTVYIDDDAVPISDKYRDQVLSRL
ncbi:LytR/AlgR family response regulator transcription factor [Neolewinella litorea]|uniref:DNA-binding response regulator n=1 Tax=Neolewinella litorea TaxID=2562452 RepID=A0A4S4NNB9_9BACT|nr:response regulator [Neolewinella litorea]THH37730.1 DNA-binding response regulator [Neolewinella litorea]